MNHPNGATFPNIGTSASTSAMAADGTNAMTACGLTPLR